MRRAPTLARALVTTLLSLLLGSLAVVPAAGGRGGGRDGADDRRHAGAGRPAGQARRDHPDHRSDDTATGHRLGPRLQRHQGRQPRAGPDAGRGRVRGDHLHGPGVRCVRRVDPSRSSGLRGGRRGQDHRPGGVATRGGPDRGRSGDRGRRGLVRGCGVPDRGRARSAGGRHRAGVHLQPAEPGPVPAVRGGGGGPVAGRRDAHRGPGGVQATLGVAAVRRRNPAPRPRPGIRSAAGSPPRCARAISPWPSPADPIRG